MLFRYATTYRTSGFGLPVLRQEAAVNYLPKACPSCQGEAHAYVLTICCFACSRPERGTFPIRSRLFTPRSPPHFACTFTPVEPRQNRVLWAQNECCRPVISHVLFEMKSGKVRQFTEPGQQRLALITYYWNWNNRVCLFYSMNLVPALRGETPFYRINTANVLPSSYSSSLQALRCVKSCKLGNHSFLFLKPRTLKASHVVWTIHTGMSKKASASSRELRNLAFVFLHMTTYSKAFLSLPRVGPTWWHRTKHPRQRKDPHRIEKFLHSLLLPSVYYYFLIFFSLPFC